MAMVPTVCVNSQGLQACSQGLLLELGAIHEMAQSKELVLRNAGTTLCLTLGSDCPVFSSADNVQINPILRMHMYSLQRGSLTAMGQQMAGSDLSHLKMASPGKTQAHREDAVLISGYSG